MSSDLLKNAISFLQKKYPKAPVVHNELAIHNAITGTSRPLWVAIAQDPESGIKQQLIVISDIVSEELSSIANTIKDFFGELDKSIKIVISNVIQKRGSSINNTQMAFATKSIIYTNKMLISHDEIINMFEAMGQLIEIVNESEMYKSLFISYGGADEKIASDINLYLKNKGIVTWFFPDDALPGQKLHRMMHEGINTHDRVLLICSKISLSRAGVLNEIEKVLEREAKEGGSEILIPITLDDYVYGDWAPSKPDIAEQIRSRVITKMDSAKIQNTQTNLELEKLVKALSKNH